MLKTNISLKNLLELNAAEINDLFLKDTDGDANLALLNLNLYIQRHKMKISDDTQLILAKHQLENILREQNNL